MMRRRGMTLIEIFVASGLMLLLLMSSESVVRYLSQETARLRSQIEPRQQIRAFLSQLRLDMQPSSYLFLTFTGTLGGVPVAIPAAGASGSQLLFAVPADESSDPDYTVVLVYPRPRSQPDDRNPNVRELVYEKFQPVKCGGVPGSINLSALVSSSRKIFDVYLPAGSVAGSDPPWSVRIDDGGGGVRLMTHFRVQPPRGEVVSERFETFVALRNNL